MNHSTPGSAGNASSFERGPAGPPAAPRPRRARGGGRTSAATRAAVRSSVPSGSGRTTKSFSVPWPFVNADPGHGPQGTEGPPEQVRAPGRASGCGGRGGTRSAAGGRTAGWRAPCPPRPRRGPPVPVERGDDLLVAERPGGGAALAQAVVEQRAGLRDQAGREHPGDAAGDPLVELAPSGGPRRAARRRSAAARRVSSRAGNGRPVSATTSRARTIRRPLLGSTTAAAAGRRRPAGRAARPVRRSASSASSSARSTGSVPGNSSSSTTACT